MIFYKAIKYTILEKCLEVLFDTLLENVNAFKIIYAKDIYPGMLLSKIKYGRLIFNNCEIISAKPEKDANMLILFKFKYKSITNDELLQNHKWTIITYGNNTCSSISILDNRNFNHKFEFIQ